MTNFQERAQDSGQFRGKGIRLLPPPDAFSPHFSPVSAPAVRYSCLLYTSVILVGGGSIILPEKLSGARNVVKPAVGGVANAIGSAISKVSGTCEKLMDYNEIPREQALAQAKSEAVELAVKAGAVRETVEIIDVEDVPLQYYPGNTCRVKVKAVSYTHLDVYKRQLQVHG